MRNPLVLITLCFGFAVAQAQTPTPTLSREPGTLTITEYMAVASIKDKVSEISSIINQVRADIERNHPGYHLNLETGLLVKDAEKPAPQK